MRRMRFALRNSDCGHRASQVLVFGALICLLLIAGCSPPPQMESDEGLKICDSLWTALTAENTNLVDNAARGLQDAHAAGKIAEPAYEYLRNVIATAREGHWAKARELTKKLIKAQRRAP